MCSLAHLTFAISLSYTSGATTRTMIANPVCGTAGMLTGGNVYLGAVLGRGKKWCYVFLESFGWTHAETCARRAR